MNAQATQSHLLHIFPSFDQGGVPIRIASIINHFAHSLRHSIVALDGRTSCRERLDPSLEVAYRDGLAEAGPLPRRLWRARRAMAALEPDLLLTYNWGAIEWALAHRLYRRCPHIHLASGFGPEEADRQKTRRALLRRLALAEASCLIVPSTTLASLAKDSWAIDAGRIALIPNGVDWERFQRARKQQARASDGDNGQLTVGALGPLRAEKNLTRLLSAFAALPNGAGMRLQIVGEGAERAGLEAASADLGLSGRVTFSGHSDRVETQLARFDVFAMSSDTEQMPNGLLQAMAAGLPVVATDVGDIKAIVAPENRRFIVPKEDQGAFVSALAALLESREERSRLGRLNAARAKEVYSQERMFAAYRQVFERYLGRAL